MPMTNTGSKVMSRFVKEYGSKKGKSVFFGKVNSSHNFGKAVGEMSVRKRAGKS